MKAYLLCGLWMLVAALPVHAQSLSIESAVPMRSAFLAETMSWRDSLEVDPERPAVTSKQRRAEMVAGVLIGSGFGMVGGAVGYAASKETCESQDEDGFYCGLGRVFLGISAGLVVGSALGVHIVGNKGEWKTPFWITMSGSLLGYASSIVLIGTTGGGAWGSVVFLVFPTVGAMVMHARGRRHRPAAALGYTAGAWNVQVPVVQLRPDLRQHGSTMAVHVPLVQMSF